MAMRPIAFLKWLPALLAAIFAFTAPARADNLCTLVVAADTGAIVYEEGDCAQRVTPASTFKIPLAVMGFDAGFLTDAVHPTLSFVAGYPDWGTGWRQDTGPARWMELSVVWYSQIIGRELGAERLTQYAQRFAYGNADFSGDPGQNNGVERSWISSSLLISPYEQAQFLGALLHRTLPVSAEAMDNTIAILSRHAAGDGWTVTGKTGSAYPRHPDSSLDRTRGWGWYVGWAERSDQTLIVVRLHQADGAGQPSGGIYVRDTLITEWPTLATQF